MHFEVDSVTEYVFIQLNFYCDFDLQEFELTLREWTELQEKISPCVTSVQAEVLTSLVQCLIILVNW